MEWSSERSLGRPEIFSGMDPDWSFCSFAVRSYLDCISPIATDNLAATELMTEQPKKKESNRRREGVDSKDLQCDDPCLLNPSTHSAQALWAKQWIHSVERTAGRVRILSCCKIHIDVGRITYSWLRNETSWRRLPIRQVWENGISEYESQSSETLISNIKIAVLLETLSCWCQECSSHIQGHWSDTPRSSLHQVQGQMQGKVQTSVTTSATPTGLWVFVSADQRCQSVTWKDLRWSTKSRSTSSHECFAKVRLKTAYKNTNDQPRTVTMTPSPKLVKSYADLTKSQQIVKLSSKKLALHYHLSRRHNLNTSASKGYPVASRRSSAKPAAPLMSVRKRKMWRLKSQTYRLLFLQETQHYDSHGHHVKWDTNQKSNSNWRRWDNGSWSKKWCLLHEMWVFWIKTWVLLIKILMLLDTERDGQISMQGVGLDSSTLYKDSD